MSGYVYKIWSENGDKVYFGSTVNPVSRWYDHRWEFTNKGRRCSSFVVFEEYGVESCKFTVVEECPSELVRQREKWWVDNHLCVNEVSPYQTEEELRLYQNRKKRERYAEKHEHINLLRTESRLKAPEVYNQKQREYRARKKILADS